MTMTLETHESSFVRTFRMGLLAKVKERFGAQCDGCDSEVRDQVTNYTDQALASKKTLSKTQKAQIKQSIMDEIFGFGPLGPVLRNPQVANIYLEGTDRAYVEKFGPRGSHQVQKLKLPFDDEEHMLDVIHRILRPLGCELKSNSPVASCILPNGSRVYAALPPVSVHGPTLSLICRDLSTIEVVPDWHVSFTHFDQLHEAKPESKQVDDKEKNSIRIVLNESKTEADLSQNFSARSLRGKKVSFCGTVQLWDDPAWGQDTDEPAEIASCYERGARAYLVACGRGGKCIDQNRMTISLRDVASKSGTQQNGAQQTGASQTFECSLEVPQQAVNLNIGVWLHGPIKAVISDLSFSADKPAMLRAGQGPKNLELVPDSTFRLDE